MSPLALPAFPVLDGRTLADTETKSWRIVPRIIRDVTELATGGLRESLTYMGAGKPLQKRKLDITLEWDTLGTMAEYVEERMAVPGPHELALWRREPLAFVGNGSRVEFEMPWTLAPDALDIPGNLDPARFEPRVHVGDNAVLSYLLKDVSGYAGTPSTGEVWFLEDDTTFKLSAAPAEGEYVYVHAVPLLQVVEAAEPAEKRFDKGPLWEPRILRLREI